MNRGGGKKRGRGRGCSPIHATINLDRCVGMDCNTTSPGLESGSMPVGREKFNDSSPGCKTEFLHDGEGKLRMASVSHVSKQVGSISISNDPNETNSVFYSGGNTSPNVGRHLVKNVLDAQYHSPKSELLSISVVKSSNYDKTRSWHPHERKIVSPCIDMHHIKTPSPMIIPISNDCKLPQKVHGGKSADGKLENSSCVHKNSSFDMCPSKNVGKLKPSLLSRNKERRTESGSMPVGREKFNEPGCKTEFLHDGEGKLRMASGSHVNKEVGSISISDDPNETNSVFYSGGNTSPNLGRHLVKNVLDAQYHSPKSSELLSISVVKSSNYDKTRSWHPHEGKIVSPCIDMHHIKTPSPMITPISKDCKLPQKVHGGKSADGKLENSSCLHKNFSFDMCPPKNVGKLKPSLLSRNKERRTEMRCHIEGDTHEILRSGMILLRGYLSFPDQVKLIKTCRDLGLDISGFYKPGYSNGAKLNLMMMCLGKNWDPETSNYTDERPFDGAIPPPIPREFQQLVKGAIQECHAILKSHSQVRSVEDVLPSMSPNICIVNFYSETGTLGLHQDKDESQESLRKKLPVVSFSIGDSAEFLYADERNIEKAQKVILKSGDVLIFGGKARHIFHGITSIKPGTAPKSLLEETNLKPGRLNLTFREY